MWLKSRQERLKILGAIGVGDKTTITQVASTGVAGSGNGYHGAVFGQNSPAYQRPSTSRLQAVDTSISPGNPLNNYSRASIL